MIRRSVFVSAILLITSLECCRVTEWNVFQPEEHVAALILARGGSKGIPLKNLASVGGKSLLERSLSVVLKAGGLDSVWVSTDHEGIALEAEKVDKSVNIHWRSEESATDDATSIFAVQEFLSHHREVDVVALVQCTSPFVRKKYLEPALRYIKLGTECVFAVSRTYKLRWEKRDGAVHPVNFNPADRKRRQEAAAEEYAENGMFYLARRRLLDKGLFQTESCQVVEIPGADGFEIDEPWHLHVANRITDSHHDD